MRGYETPIVLTENGHDRADGEGQTYLRVAEIVLSEALSPLKAREIVERGIEQGLFGDHVMSRTPEKSMQARLSIDILSQGQNSRFARTSKGRFTLRSKLSDSRGSEGGSEEDRVE
nr:winged helix-turn-helix domain-containing protein [Bradyrhizobium sp. CCBAU 43298]